MSWWSYLAAYFWGNYVSEKGYQNVQVITFCLDLPRWQPTVCLLKKDIGHEEKENGEV